MDINQDDLFNKTDILLFAILEELKQLNKSLHSMRKDTGNKSTKPKVKSKPKQKDDITKPETETIIGGVLNVSDTNS